MLDQVRSTQQYRAKVPLQDTALVERMIQLATQYWRYGYRRITALLVREWLERIGVKTLFIEPGSPWENGYLESFNGKLRDELLNGGIFYTLKEAQSLVQGWRREYNQVRPHSSLGYRPSAPAAMLLQPATLRFAGSNDLLPAPIL